ncbi:MAG: hypothetical protein PXY39_06195 [archaeon]|nr:hypothetical protein [archaeon]
MASTIPLLQRIRSLPSLSKPNLARLALVSVFITSADIIQSFYFQRVIDISSEGNAIPRAFFSIGPLGYVLYGPVEFLAIYGTLTIIWLWASYLLWYRKHIVAARHLF